MRREEHRRAAEGDIVDEGGGLAAGEPAPSTIAPSSIAERGRRHTDLDYRPSTPQRPGLLKSATFALFGQPLVPQPTYRRERRDSYSSKGRSEDDGHRRRRKHRDRDDNDSIRPESSVSERPEAPEPPRNATPPFTQDSAGDDASATPPRELPAASRSRSRRYENERERFKRYGGDRPKSSRAESDTLSRSDGAREKSGLLSNMRRALF